MARPRRHLVELAFHLYLVRHNLLAYLYFWFYESESLCDGYRYGGQCYTCRSDILTAERLREYMWFLMEGKGRAYEQRLWKAMVSETESHIHHINHEIVLPAWIPCAMWCYNHARIGIYVLLVITSHLWLGPLLSLTYVTCQPGIVGGDGASCSIPIIYTQLEGHIPHVDYYHRLFANHARGSSVPLVEYRDVETGRLFFAYPMLDGTYRWINEAALRHRLATQGNESCVCPIFMGITANVTFMRLRQDEWLVMHRPFVYRNNTLSNLIESSIRYHKESPYYGNYARFMESVMPVVKQIHYETLYVEYTKFGSTSSGMADGAACSTETVAATHSRMFTTHKVHAIQQTITLSHADAICFHFCDATNRVVLMHHY